LQPRPTCRYRNQLSTDYHKLIIFKIYKPDYWMKINEFSKETKQNNNRPPSMQDTRSRQDCTAAIVARKGHTEQDSSFECPSRGSIRCLIYLIWETLHHH